MKHTMKRVLALIIALMLAVPGIAFSEEEAAKVLAEHDIEILIDLHDGAGEATAWGCDLTHGYITINADYRT